MKSELTTVQERFDAMKRKMADLESDIASGKSASLVAAEMDFIEHHARECARICREGLRDNAAGSLANWPKQTKKSRTVGSPESNVAPGTL